VLIQSEYHSDLEASVSGDVTYGQRRASNYDQLDELQVYNVIDDNTQVYNDLVDYTLSPSASTLEHRDQTVQQFRHKFKLVILYV
jgi:hypothetical protein